MQVNLFSMREIVFYKTKDDKCPVEDFLDSLSSKQAQKAIWVMQLIEELEQVPTTYLKKLTNTDEIWEIRIQQSNNIFRLLGFFNKGQFIVLTNGFQKKTQKTPKSEISLAENRKADYLQRTEND